MEVFLNNILQGEKDKFIGRYLKFATAFIKQSTFKTVAKMVKTDLPKILGYERCEMFLFDSAQKNLYSTSIDEEADAQMKAEGPPGFEVDYIIEEKQIVRFPLEMGITGYCLKQDAIAMINDFQTKFEDKTNAMNARITSYRQSCFNELA